MFIAANAFFGHKDRSGQDYVLHLLAIFDSTKSNLKRAVGLLHDLIEDTPWTLQDLRDVRLPEIVVQGVDYVSKRQNELYFDFVERCGTSVKVFDDKEKYVAIDVKLSDLEHNMDVSRQTALLDQRYIEKLDVYIISHNYLVAIKREEIPPGTPMAKFMSFHPRLNRPDLLQLHSSGRQVANDFFSGGQQLLQLNAV
ncbi:MAG: hypothetical protein ABTQ34_05030 [Bdellovibrionales bacterium]